MKHLRTASSFQRPRSGSAFRKAQKLSGRAPRRTVHQAPLVSVVHNTGRAPYILLLLCCTFFFPPRSPTPAVSLLRGLRMNSHCHVQGRVAQGQLIAFMIMISRQIYCACSEHIFQVLPTLLAQTGKMSLRLRAVTSCLSAGHTF